MHEATPFLRVRDITDAMGSRLRLTVTENTCVARHACGARVVLEHPDARGRPQATLDGYGAEVLAGFVMAARLSLPDGLPDELVVGSVPTRLRLARSPGVALVITQADLERPFAISATFWDRLYAELCLATAHMREIDRRAGDTQAGHFAGLRGAS